VCVCVVDHLDVVSRDLTFSFIKFDHLISGQSIIKVKFS
jgi:hypothetical protein